MKNLITKAFLTSILAFFLVANAIAGEVMDRILAKGELVVGTTGTQVPFTAKAKAGGVIGMDIDLAKLIAVNMGVKVKFETMPFAELLPKLEAGKIDLVLSGMTMTLQRNRKVAFVG
ncbi:transporter substrate-binding domain-containing protein, partial [Pseudomonadota bacterium]